MKNTYAPVEWVYREIIEEEVEKGTYGSVFYFCDDTSICSEKGTIERLEDTPEGIFISLDSGIRIRVDRIITLFGKPGASYEAYDAFANACLDCTGGYDLEKLN